jgi:beta-lactamase class A
MRFRLPPFPLPSRFVLGLALAAGFAVPAPARAQAAVRSAALPATAATAPWQARLQAELSRLKMPDPRGAVGVYVRDLDTGLTVSKDLERPWYLASMVKVPVAIAVMRGIERGDFRLDTPLTVRASDYVDGAGPTNRQPMGKPLSVRFLLDQMIIQSDNMATDMLIDLVGVAEVNALVATLVPDGFARITTLGEVRRQIYGRLVPGAERLSGRDLILLHRQRGDAERMQLLSHLLQTPVERFHLPTLDAAYDAYYASGLNTGHLDAYGQLLALLADGKALSPKSTDHLLKVMTRVATGTDRLKAGLPSDVSFAHKTGTQRRRICDAGLIRAADPSDADRARRVVVVACVRDVLPPERAEAVLMQVGTALCKSGLVTRGVPDAPSCQAPALVRLPAAAVER